MGRGEREGGVLKTALMVAGGLVLAWVTMETAFKPFLDRLRSSISRSDPARDPDDNDDDDADADADADGPSVIKVSDEDEKAEEVPKSD